MQHRNKVGGIIDRRFGENDPSMAPEDKMVERFATEKQRLHKKSSMFDLEGDDDVEPLEGLTHAGKALRFDVSRDDFDEADLDLDDDSDGDVRQRQMLKRVRALAATDAGEEDGPQRKKSKKEVMEELIAKSKAHKYERQDAKDKDDDLRAELDKDLRDIRNLLWSSNGTKKPDAAEPQAATIAGIDRQTFEKGFDLQVKKLAQDARAKPSDRTKTEEEKADEESERLKELEDRRQRRMRGEEITDSEGDDEDQRAFDGHDGGDSDEEGDDNEFGLGQGIVSKPRPTATDLGFDDEDDFLIDDDLVASGSDVEDLEDDDASGEEIPDEEEEDEEDEFIKDILNQEEASNPAFSIDIAIKEAAKTSSDDHGLPFTFTCPGTLAEFQATCSNHPDAEIPTIVQRIRALYHPKLDSKNKDRLSGFAQVLVDFLASYDATSSMSFSIIESITRHVHSLAKMFPIEISEHFLSHLETIGDTRPLALEAGDVVLLTAIGTIFPTSDHFHQVVTPAMLTIGRYLGQKVPQTLSDYALGVYLSILALQYQSLSKRYVPEVMNFILNTINNINPCSLPNRDGDFVRHAASPKISLRSATKVPCRRLTFMDFVPHDVKATESAILRVSILNTCLQIMDSAADTWTGTPAFPEIFGQVAAIAQIVSHPKSRAHIPAEVAERAAKLHAKVERMVRLSIISRRPLELHHHRPLAIKTYIPKFEDTFDPTKHYDPDRERAELAKLQKEHKRERKGAIRELRKDANFMARENLKVKKVKDAAYEKKYKRLVAEIQSEEGRESNMYEREKSARKRAKNR